MSIAYDLIGSRTDHCLLLSTTHVAYQYLVHNITFIDPAKHLTNKNRNANKNSTQIFEKMVRLNKQVGVL